MSGVRGTQRRSVRRIIATAASAVLLATGLSACSSTSGSGGDFAYCTDPTYPPAEFYQVTKSGTSFKKELVGADIDIGRALAKKMGRGTRYVSTPFSKIIQALLDKKCDAIISFINNTAERRKQMTFVNYLAAGQDIMSKKSSPAITGLSDLYGRTVSVATGTTEESFLKSANTSAPSGKSVQIKSYGSENDAILALHDNKVQAYFGDAPIVAAALSTDSTLARGPELVKPIPVGIALRPGDSHITKLRDAVATLYDNGTMGQILTKWRFTKYAITP